MVKEPEERMVIFMPKRGENVRKRKDGRWEGRFISGYKPDGKAKYQSVYGSGYLKTKRKLVQATEQFKSGALPEPCKSMSFREVLFHWLHNRKTKLRSQTYNKYSKLIENHLAESIGAYKLHQIDSTLLNQFIADKLCNGRVDEQGGLSVSYAKTLVFIIRSAMEFAVAHSYCTPIKGSFGELPKDKPKIHVFTIDEQKRIEEYVQTDMDGSKLGVFLCLNTGLRIGEMCGLKWSDIDFKQNTLSVQRTVYRANKQDNRIGEPKTKLTVGEPKTPASFRVIPIPSFLFPVLLEHKKTVCSEWVVAINDYGIPDPRSHQYKYKKILNDCSVPYKNFHSCRHTFASRCIEVGVDIKSLSEMLGHASVNITLDTYVHSSLEQKRNQIELLGTIRGQKSGHQTA